MSQPSTVKVLWMLEEMQAFDDADLEAALPLGMPAVALRMMLAAVAPRIPQDPIELDSHLTNLIEFLAGLRSDPPALEPEPEPEPAADGR